MSNILSPAEVVVYTTKAGIAKANKPLKALLLTSIMAGMFIAFAAVCSLGAAYNMYWGPNSYGLGKLIQAVLFPAGLMFVIFTGADLFTGNILLTIAAIQKKIKVRQALLNWLIVWVGNLIGAIFIAVLIYYSGVFGWKHAGEVDGLAHIIEKIGNSKISIDFWAALASGILCNILVCTVIIVTYTFNDAASKILLCFFGIMLFVVSGFEHVVANMGYMTAYVMLTNVNTIPSILINNFIPVTIGNVLGGVIFSFIYYYSVKNMTTKKVD